ncbi:MAG: pyrroloquinoline quinone-dependent dehydrogenase [Bryobacterales bacterium]|nr:pyrroloquinoline quinone-dependent dehydrogenase [Bryobacterales bacterium]
MPSIDRRSFLQKTAAGLAASSLPALPGPRPAAADAAREWRHYGGDALASRYSPAEQITRSNVKNLKVAWTHKSGDASERPSTTIECTPIVVDGVMYITTAQLQIRALDASTGKVLWNHDPFAGVSARQARGVNRAVCYWNQGSEKRIFVPIRDEMLCLDAKTGELVKSFGEGGRIDLKKDFDHDMTGLSFRHTSPPVVYKDLLIVAGGGGEGPYPEAPGHIRGYDARTGKRRWIFHTIPHPGEYGYDTWPKDGYKRSGGTNCWGGMSLDETRGLVFAGIGSPSFDFYGGDRIGANLFGNCVLALKADSGERAWHFQTVHHDVWDYDLPAQPALVTIRQGGRTIDACVQVTKQGWVFVFDRQTGKPVFPVEERPVKKSDVPGEQLWPTQPIPLKPPTISRQGFFEEYITDVSPEAHAHVREIFERSRAGAIYEPPSLQGTLVHPGFRGGALWGGCSFDPKRNRLFVNSDESTNRITLAPAEPDKPFRYALPERAVLQDPDGHPGMKPPWGYVTAIDMDKGEFAWRIVNGEIPALVKKGIRKTGSPSHGGTIATAGGLVYMGGTFDSKFRAFDSDSGEVLWEHQLSAGGFATPCTYEANGKQYVVIAAGGGKRNTRSGDEFVAFALP